MMTPDYSQMTQDEEVASLIAVIKEQDVDILAQPACYGILREALNNEVLSAFEAQHPQLAFADGAAEADYSALDDNLFYQLLRALVGEMSISVQLGYGAIYSEMREALNNPLLDHWAATHQHKAYGITVAEVQAHAQSRNISDDDLCADCQHLYYVPGQLSLCKKAVPGQPSHPDWPGIVEEDDCISDCPELQEIADEEDNVLPDGEG